MCVAFSMADVYDYVFSPAPGLKPVTELSKSVITTFRIELEREIIAHGDQSPHYKTVYFSRDKQAVESFFSENSERYLDFGSYVVFRETPTAEQADSVVRRHGDRVVAKALENARQLARTTA